MFLAWVMILTKYLECADIGPNNPEGFPQHRCRGHGVDHPKGDARECLQNV
jgi:hypothetical protein